MSDSSKQTDSSGVQKKKPVTRIGDFELKKRLGKGGMGEVFLAKQVSLDRPVALKTLAKEFVKKEDFVARFLREARSMAKLDHPNVVKVYAVDSYKGVHFAAIEYVDGKSVQDWLNKLTTFSIPDAVHIAMASAEALVHAHAQNMVHRDIKPDNILLTSKGVVKVADFGLAKVLDEDVSMTQSGTGLGTPLYMAPEQGRSAKNVDQRSDIYALGATLYHMLTGQLPFTGTTAVELILAKETGKFDSARKSRPEIPEKLDLIIDRMMARDPAHRYSSCTDVLNDLASLSVHSDSLSFIDGAQPAGVGRSAAPTKILGNTATDAPSSQGFAEVSSRDDARRSEKKKTSGRVWFVQFTDPQGNAVVEKHSTRKVLKQIEAGTFTAKARAKASAGGSYLPLAKFPEFAEAIDDQLTRQSLLVRKKDMASLYDQVERDQKRRRRWRWASNKFRGMVGTVSLIAWIAAIAVLLGLIYLIGKGLFTSLGSHVEDMMG